MYQNSRPLFVLDVLPLLTNLFTISGSHAAVLIQVHIQWEFPSHLNIFKTSWADSIAITVIAT